jgi:hypothetical protein
MINEVKEQLIFSREEYINLIKAELIGPGSEFSVPDIKYELISSNPISRYSVGILYPQGNQVNQDNDETIPKSDGDTEPEHDTTDDSQHDVSEVPISSLGTREFEFDETASENLDEEIGLSAQHMPSSMGITFIVKGNTDTIHGEISFATYRNAEVTDCVIPFIPNDAEHYSVPAELAHKMIFDKEKGIIRLLSSVTAIEIRDIFERDSIPENDIFIKQIAYRFVDFCRKGYVRVPHTVDFTIDFSKSDYVDNNRELDGTTAKITALRTKINDSLWSLTVMLINDIEEVPVRPYHCIFQAKLTIVSEQNNFIFEESNPNIKTELMDDEEWSLELLYRDKKIYGTGLGTSIEWSIDTEGNGKLWSEFFPQAEVSPINFDLPENDVLSLDKLSMKFLSDLDKTDKMQKLSALKSLVDLYKNWVYGLLQTTAMLDSKYQPAAQKNIAECMRAYNRMYEGIKMLESNERAYSAFMLANRAMFMQRVHLRMQSATVNKDRYPGDEEIAELLKNMDYFTEDDSDCRWRPFQIAFLLMDVCSIVYDNSEDRSIVDLIWFPTGGGKTEAYLGLSAFTIFYRKLVYPQGAAGTAVIMRYTLRLLAAQQFTRAATLICACEYIRQDCVSTRSTYPAYPLGKVPITIGLWIGGKHIPNKK